MLELPEGLQSLITQLFHVVPMYTFLCVSMQFEGNVFGSTRFQEKATDVFQDGSPQIPSEEKATAQLAGKPEAAETNMGTPRDIGRPVLLKKVTIFIPKANLGDLPSWEDKDLVFVAPMDQRADFVRVQRPSKVVTKNL